MTQTVSLVHVNISLVLTVHLLVLVYCFGWRDTTDSTASPQFRRTFWWTVWVIQFSSCVESWL